MELRQRNIIPIIVALLLIVCSGFTLSAQTQNTTPPSSFKVKNKYFSKDGCMKIQLERNQSIAQVDSFAKANHLEDIHLGQLWRSGNLDSAEHMGWLTQKINGSKILLVKPLYGLDSITDVEVRMMFTKKGDEKINFDSRGPSIVYGFNHFKNQTPFTIKDSIVTFILRSCTKAHSVILSGSFNKWSTNALHMVKTIDGWKANVKLSPGKYWYKFIVDGNWIEDPDNLQKERNQYDGFNSVYFVPNTIFYLKGHTDAKSVYLSGSFNNWRKDELPLTKTMNGWEINMYLAEGSYSYKYLVEGNWITDPDNPKKINNGQGGINSLYTSGAPYIFKLTGASKAKDVILSGSFNNWKPDELHMIHKEDGWELPYVLQPGNYEYKFIVDGKWISDPDNPIRVKGEDQNSFLVVNPTYTFKLKGYPTAHRVYVSGDFSNWEQTYYPMARHGDEWTFTMHLAPGKHTYKFVVDDHWITDPANKNIQSEGGNTNSVLWIEK